MNGKAIAAAIVGVALALGVPFALDGANFIGALADVAPGALVMLAALALISGIAKAGKLQLLQLRLGQQRPFRRTLAISLASDFAFLTSPAGVAGYMVNITLLRRAGSSWSTAASVVAGEQALDLVFFAVCVPLCALFAIAPLMQVISSVPTRVYAAVALLTLMTAGLWYGRHRIAAFVGNFVAVRRPGRIAAFISELRSQLVEIANGDRRNNSRLLLLTGVQWFARYGALWWALDALGHRLPFGFILVLQAGVLHLAQWTGVPGGGGGADLALAAVLSHWLPQATLAVVLPLWRFSTLYVPLIAGALSFAALPRNHNRQT